MTHLAVERQVSASTQNQAKSAILYLYQFAPYIPVQVRWRVAPRAEGAAFARGYKAHIGKVASGTLGHHLWPTDRAKAKACVRQVGGLKDSSNRNRFGPLYRSCCHPVHGNEPGGATVGGASQPGGGPVRHWGRAFIRIATSMPRRANLYPAPSQGFHARGRVGSLMKG